MYNLIHIADVHQSVNGGKVGEYLGKMTIELNDEISIFKRGILVGYEMKDDRWIYFEGCHDILIPTICEDNRFDLFFKKPRDQGFRDVEILFNVEGNITNPKSIHGFSYGLDADLETYYKVIDNRPLPEGFIQN